MILGVIGASLLGGEILSIAEAGGTRVVRCFDATPIEGLESHFRGAALEVEPLVASEIKKCDVVICATEEVPTEIRNVLSESAIKVIDCCGVFKELPLVHPYLRSSGIEGKKVRLPETNAAHLATIACALSDNSSLPRISHIFDTIFEPVGSGGHLGIDELWQQGIAIYNHRGVDVEQFSAQTAFNCIPFGFSEDGSEGSAHEVALAEQIEFFSSIPKTSMVFQMVRIPVYAATCHSLSIFFDAKPNEKEVLKVLKDAPSIELSKKSEEFIQPLTLGDSTNIRIDRVRAGTGNAITMWVVADNTRIRAQMVLDVADGFLNSEVSI